MTITRYFEDRVNPTNFFFFFNSIVEGGEIWTLDIEVRKYKNMLVELQGSWLSHVKYEIKLNYQQI